MNRRVAELMRLEAERGLTREEHREYMALYGAGTVPDLLRANAIDDSPEVKAMCEKDGVVSFGPRSHLYIRMVEGGYEVGRHNGRQWVNMGRTFSANGVMALVTYYRSLAPDYPRWGRDLQKVIRHAEALS